MRVGGTRFARSNLCYEEAGRNSKYLLTWAHSLVRYVHHLFDIDVSLLEGQQCAGALAHAVARGAVGQGVEHVGSRSLQGVFVERGLSPPNVSGHNLKHALLDKPECSK